MRICGLQAIINIEFHVCTKHNELKTSSQQVLKIMILQLYVISRIYYFFFSNYVQRADITDLRRQTRQKRFHIRVDCNVSVRLGRPQLCSPFFPT